MRFKERTVTVLAVLAWSAMAIVCLFFAAIVGDIVLKGIHGLSLSFITSLPEDSGRAGGILSVLYSTLLIVLVCVAVVVPVGLGVAIFLSMFTKQCGAISSIVRMGLDTMASTPSIVFGLFGSAFFCIFLGMGFSILAGGLTLACMVLPVVIRMCEQGISAVSSDYYMNAEALGLSKTSMFFKVLLPMAAPALTAALIIGVGRAMSETAALLFTSGYVLRMPESLLDSGRSLSVHIFDLSMNIPGGDNNAYTSALVLIVMLILLNSTALWIMNNWLNRHYGK